MAANAIVILRFTFAYLLKYKIKTDILVLFSVAYLHNIAKYFPTETFLQFLEGIPKIRHISF